jgi:hypothetical protein
MSNHATYSAYPQRILVPHASYLAYAPRGAGVLCALCYFTANTHVCGWWTGARGLEFAPGYFMLESFYATAGTRFFAAAGGDLYGGWRCDYERDPPELSDPVPVDDGICHRLEALQSAFAAEWLFLADDPASAPEIAEYEAAGLPVQPSQALRGPPPGVDLRLGGRGPEPGGIPALALAARPRPGLGAGRHTPVTPAGDNRRVR